MKIDYNQIIDEYCLFDNDFMRLCFKEKPECVEFILKIILPQIAGLKVTKIKSEYEIDSLISHAVCLDAYAVDEKGTMYDIEVQRDDKGANPKRVRYNGSLMDCDFLKKGEKYEKLPVRYVIFISKNGYKCNGKPMRTFSNKAEDDGEPLGDETYAIYVNGANEEDTDLGKLMRDLQNPNPDTMNYELLSNVVGYFKKTEEGRSNAMTASEKVYNYGFNEGVEQGKLFNLFDLTKDGFLSIEIAAKKANMTIQDFRNQMKLAGYCL